MSSSQSFKHDHAIAARAREACIHTALDAWENASISGLCGEGAFEAAVSAMRMLDLDEVVQRQRREDGGGD